MENIAPASHESPYSSEPDSNQLQAEDTLYTRGTTDVLDEGFSPPERPRSNHFGETAWEELHGETLDQRLAEEEPELWEVPLPSADLYRAGRIASDPDALEGQDNDTYAVDVGIDGGAASAEEAAIHIIEEP